MTWTDRDDIDENALRERHTVKWSTYPDDVLAAWVAEMDLPTDPVVLRALREAVDAEELGYPVADLDTGLPDALEDWYGNRCEGEPPSPEQIHLLPDVLKGIELGIEYFSAPGSAVVLPTPAYMPFFEVIDLVGREVVEVPLVDGRLDLSGVDAALDAGAGTVLLCQPHNPTGRVFGSDQLRELAGIVSARDCRVVSDEVHGPLTYGKLHQPYAAVSAEAADHALTVTSASKGWNLPGLKCAVALTHNDADEEVWRTIPGLRTHGASTLGIVASTTAFVEGRDWLDETIAYLGETRGWFAGLLAEHLPEVGYDPPDATYFAWLDCRGLELPAEPAAWFLQHAKVALNPGPPFGRGSEGFVRLNLATSRQLLERIVVRMARAVRAAHP